jgi:tetratricopeptide (TPR) repeat protein
MGASVQANVRKVELKAAKARKIVSKKIAKSPVGSGAKQVARRSRLLESRLVRLLTKSVLGLSALVPEPVRKFSRTVGQAILRVCGVFLVFIARWFSTRRYWHLVGGIPAFLLALPLAYCMIRMPFHGDAVKARQYRSAVQQALHNKNYEAADLYFRKLYQLGAMNERAEYHAACSAYASGDLPQAVEQMRKLAPENEPGYPPAHVWLARRHLTGESGLPREDADRLAEQHLKFALDREPGNPEARTLLAVHFERAGRYDDAVSELQQVVKHLPEQGLTLAQLYARQGRWSAARREVQKVLDLYAQKEQKGVTLGSAEFEIWSMACLIMNEPAKAEEVLERGLVEHPNDVALTERLRALCLARSDALQSQRINPQEQLRLLVRACQLKPDDRETVVRLSERTHHAGASGQQARQAIQDLLDQDQSPQILLAVLGTQAAERGDYPTAAKHLRAACRQDPQDAQSLNNLAWVLLQMGDGHYDEGLSLAVKAVSIKPQEAMYRETRGQLLMRLGRYRQAVEDLEYALNGLGESSEIHQLLALAYDQLGEAERAQAHRQSANAD